MTLLSVRRELGEFRKRYKWMALFVLLSMSGVLVRLSQLQLLEHAHWAKEAERNIMKRIRLPATRGLIRDATGKVVATNRASYIVYLTPQLLERRHIDLFARLMSFDDDHKAEFLARLAQIPERRRSHVVALYNDITRDQLAALETHKRELPGLQIVAVPIRTYPFGGLGAHAIGFLNEVNAEDLKRSPERSYQSGDAIGRSGVEAAWESYLRGHDGELTVVVDVRGRESETPGSRLQANEHRREPSPGRDLKLTLDMDLMRVVERAFRGHPSGGAVVVDVHTGRVRALFSKPAYDLNEMSGRLTADRAVELSNSPFRPLIDKTVYETYFPGSTFKPVSALAALQDGLLTPSNHFECPGFYDLGKRRFRCSHAHGESVDMRKALIQSCNVYFYHLAEQVGLDRIANLSHDFGLGAVTGIGINTEAQGFVPTRDWYMKQHGNQYHIGFTLNAAIGQGNTRVSLIQLAMAYAAMANGGTLYVPQLVQAVEAPDGSTVEEFPPRVRRHVSIDPGHLSYVKEGMVGVVNDPNGTAYDARIEGGIPVAGKTGTAQVSVGRLPGSVDVQNAWYYRRSHAWFAGFAPADDPQLAIVVLVEHGGQGGKYSAPIAIRILQEALGGGPAHSAQNEKAAPTGAQVAARGKH